MKPSAVRSSARSNGNRGAGQLTAAAIVLAIAPGAAIAFPDAPPWGSGSTEAGCHQCHFGAPVREASESLTLAGLPGELTPGRTYRLVLTLADDAMKIAGFLLTASADGEPAGTFESLDERTESKAAEVRSTKPGTTLSDTSRTDWTVEWTAPDAIAEPTRFEAWANAANDDLSSFGDVTYRKNWTVEPASGESGD